MNLLSKYLFYGFFKKGLVFSFSMLRLYSERILKSPKGISLWEQVKGIFLK